MKKTSIILLIFLLSSCSFKSKDNPKNLVIYSPNSQGIMGAVIPLFEEKTGIKVDVISAGTGELMKRIENEKDNPQADVLFGGGYTHYFQNKHLFQDYISKENEQVVEAYQNTEGYVTYTVLDGSVLVVNKELTEDLEIKGYKDLLTPELKGKISTADPSNSSSAFAQLTNILLAMSDDETYTSEASWQYVKELVDLWDGKVQSGSSSVYKSVLDGEMWVGLTYEDPVAMLLKAGASNIDIIYPEEGTVFLPAGTGIVKGAKNVENARKFVDFLLSEDVQNIFGTTLTNRPVRKGALIGNHMKPFEDINLIYEQMDYVHKHKDEIVKRYMDIFIQSQ